MLFNCDERPMLFNCDERAMLFDCDGRDTTKLFRGMAKLWVFGNERVGPASWFRIGSDCMFRDVRGPARLVCTNGAFADGCGRTALLRII